MSALEPIMGITSGPVNWNARVDANSCISPSSLPIFGHGLVHWPVSVPPANRMERRGRRR